MARRVPIPEQERIRPRSFYPGASEGVRWDLTEASWQEIIQTHGGRCYYCQRDDVPLEIEHVIPVRRGGEHTVSNVVPACRACNVRKGKRTADEYLAGVRLPTTKRIPMDIGESIRRIRESKSYDQAELAKLAGLSASTLWRIEHGQRTPRGRTLRGIAEALGVGIGELRGEPAQ